MPIDLATRDPATLEAGPDLNALMAEFRGWHKEWRVCGLNQEQEEVWCDSDGNRMIVVADWHPSTNPAHAGELRREAESWRLETEWWQEDKWGKENHLGVICDIGDCTGWCLLSETDNDLSTPGGLREAAEQAEALATCRAVAAMLKAKAESDL